jgi:Zinc carboxypeptidase
LKLEAKAVYLSDMHAAILVCLFLLALSMNIYAQTYKEFAEMWEKQHVSKILPSNVRHKDLKDYLEHLKKIGIKVDEVGRSVSNREIYQAEFGKGQLKVFLWSQMHGDEPTATSAVIDLLAILRKHRASDWVKNIEKTMTIRVVPMLNPDGSDAYIRRNIQGLDINRDAQNLKSPEAQLLKKLRDEWSPQIGFNLHNQNALTTVGQTYKQAAISFLVVFGDAAKTTNNGHERNKRLVSAMIQAIQGYIPGNIGRYDDGYTPSAFGDNFSAWGTPVILIETGALHGESEMFLVKMNFIAIATALKILADGSEKNVSPVVYDQLPPNTSARLFYIIFRNASVVDTSEPDQVTITITDIGANTERRRAQFTAPTIVRQMGGLSSVAGLDEYDASNFYAVGRFQPLAIGNFAEILFYKKDRQIDWSATDLEKTFPPDAIFSLGKWIKGEGVVPRK